MQYDPIKRSLGNVFNKKPFLRILFYRMLDILLLRTWHIKKEVRKWAANSKAGAHILDAGSGFGQYVYYLSRYNQGFKIRGTDIKEEQIADCSGFFRRTGKENVTFTLADLTTYIEKEQYDLILSVDVMEHILEDVLVFKNFYASLKNNGMLLISTPSDKGGSDAHDDDEHSFIEEHVRNGYNIDEIIEKLKTAGFIKAEAYYSYGKPGNISWKLSMKYPIKMLGFSKLFFIIIPFYYLLTFPFCLILNYLDVKNKHLTGTGLIVKAWKY